MNQITVETYNRFYEMYLTDMFLDFESWDMRAYWFNLQTSSDFLE
jgi:hypothetical protein